MSKNEQKVIFKTVSGYPLYRISNTGVVQSCRRRGTTKLHGWIDLKQAVSRGYKHVLLYSDNGKKVFSVHRLVATHFIKNINGLKVVNHKDANKTNNAVDNLEWVTHKDNVKHAFQNGLIKRHGVHNSRAKLDDLKVLTIRTLINTGWTNTRIAYEYGVKPHTISNIKHGITWRHLHD